LVNIFCNDSIFSATKYTLTKNPLPSLYQSKNLLYPYTISFLLPILHVHSNTSPNVSPNFPAFCFQFSLTFPLHSNSPLLLSNNRNKLRHHRHCVVQARSSNGRSPWTPRCCLQFPISRSYLRLRPPHSFS